MTTSHCDWRRSSGQQRSGEVTDRLNLSLLALKCNSFWPLGGRTDSKATIYIWCKSSAGCRKCLRCNSLVGLRWHCRFFGSADQLQSCVVPADGKTLYITGSDSRETSLQKNVGQENKQLLARRQNKRVGMQTQQSKALTTRKHFAFWENLSPFCTVKASSPAKWWWLRCFLAVRLSAQWFQLLSYRKVTH